LSQKIRWSEDAQVPRHRARRSRRAKRPSSSTIIYHKK